MLTTRRQVVSLNAGHGSSRGGSYGSVTTTRQPLATRAEKAIQALEPFEADTGLSPGDPSRILSTSKLYQIYWTTPDLRSGMSSIARRISTRDWSIEPDIDPRDDRYAEALAAATRAARFLMAPAENYTWQQWAYEMTLDMLIYDQGVSELARVSNEKVAAQRTGRVLASMRAYLGDQFAPRADIHRNVTGYDQIVDSGYATVTTVPFTADELLVLVLHPDTTSLRGRPMIESLINEVISMLVKSDRLVSALDADEIPPGILVLGGLANEALQLAQADLRSLKGRDHKIRVMGGQGDVKATWVELQRDLKDLEFLPLVKDVRRTIWRLLGIQPIEMGDVEDVNRATSEVQFEVGDSHLIGPILEMIEQAMNSRVLPLLIVDDDLRSLVKFTFKRDKPLSPEQEKARTEADVADVRAGLRTRNEVRQSRGLAPQNGGDILTVEVGGQIVPLASATEGSSFRVGDVTAAAAIAEKVGSNLMTPEAAVAVLMVMLGVTQEQAEAMAGTKALPSGDGGDGGDGGNDPEPENPDDGPEDASDTPGEVEASTACGHNHKARATEDPDLPSDWQPRGRFADVRTVDLKVLARTVANYTRGVTPVWVNSRDRVVTSFANAFSEEGLTANQAADLTAAIHQDMQRLAMEWGNAADPRYKEAADVGRDAASRFTKKAFEDGEQAALYRSAEMGYLTAADGLLGELEMSLNAIVTALQNDVGIRQKTQKAEADISSLDGLDAVLATVAHAFNSQQNRIKNYAGALVELAQGVLGNTMATDEAVWYVEWVKVGDKGTCTSCDSEGARGIVKASSMQRWPGSVTLRCQRRCRCVTTWWTMEEVESGDAYSLN